MSIVTIVCIGIAVIGFVLGIVGICFYSFSSLFVFFCYSGIVLFICALIALLMTRFIQKEVKYDVKYDENAKAVCPHCGAINDNKTPYCTKCGCRLK